MAEAPPDLSVIMNKVVKKYPLSYVHNLGSRKKEQLHFDVIPTGCLRLDYALGAGGIPRYRFTELWGPEEAGKTSLVSTMMARLSVTPQKKGKYIDERLGGTSVLIDLERKLDTDYFSKCIVNSGGDLSRCGHIQPPSGAAPFEIAMALVGKVDLIIFDSITWFTPTKIAKPAAGVEDSFFALQARMLGPNLQRLSGLLFESGRTKERPIGTAFIGICQARAEIHGFKSKFRDGLRPGAAHSWRHIKSMAIYAHPFGWGLSDIVLDTQKNPYGMTTYLKVEKNVIDIPRQAIEKPPVMIKFEMGVDLADDVMEMGKTMGLLEYVKKKGDKSTSYYWVESGEKIAAGEQRTREYLNDVNPQARDELRAEIGERIQERARGGAALQALAKFVEWNTHRAGERVAYTVDEKRVALWQQENASNE